MTVFFPRALGSLNQTTGTPVRATAPHGGPRQLLVLVGTFQQIVAFFICTALGIHRARRGRAVRRPRGNGQPRFRCLGIRRRLRCSFC